MDRNTDINFSNQPTEQRSSSIDRSAYNSAEAQRAQTTLHPGGTLQSSDIGLGTETMVPRKQQDIPKNVNGFDLFHLNLEYQPTFNDPDKRHTFGQTQETPDVRARKTSEPSVATRTSPPSRYATNQQRRSVPYDETISFFGDSNATDNKHYPSRSLLDQEGLHRGSIGTLPHAGDSREHRRSSALSGSGEQQRDSLSTPMHRTSSALSGAGDFLPREESSTTPAMNDVPIGDRALHPEDKVSAAPVVTGNLPSTHEPAGLLPQSDQAATPQSPTVNQGASTHQPLEGEGRDREKSYSEMASEAAANVTATAKGAIATVATGATAAAAALFGASKEDEERAKRESNVEPAIHGQEADYDSKDKVRRESAPDDQHPFCKSVHEPVIHGQTACYHCVKTDDENAQTKPSAAEITGAAAALGAAGTVGTAGAVLVTPDPIGTSTVIEDDDSDIDHILKRPTNTDVQTTGIQTTDQPTEWAGQPYPATDGVLAADKHNFGLNRPLPPESNNESMSSTRAINGDPISEEDEIKQRASTAPTDKTIESPSEHQQNRRSSLTAGLKSKAVAGGAAFASAFRRLSHGPSSPTETDRRVSDAEAFKQQQQQQQQQQQHHHVHGADKAIDTEKQVNNYAIPEDVMKARENNRQLEEDYGKNYPKKEFTRQSGPTSQSPQVVPTDINTPYDTHAVGESGFTHGSDRAAGPTSTVVADIPVDTAGATAVGASAGATAAANADANKALENITPSRPHEEVTTTTSSAPESRTQPATISPTNSTNTWTTAPMVADQPRHAFGGSHAFGNRDIVAPVQQEIAKAPGIESMKVAGVPGQTEGQDNFVKEENNEQRRTSRKGSIQKVIGKIFHK